MYKHILLSFIFSCVYVFVCVSIKTNLFFNNDRGICNLF